MTLLKLSDRLQPEVQAMCLRYFQALFQPENVLTEPKCRYTYFEALTNTLHFPRHHFHKCVLLYVPKPFDLPLKAFKSTQPQTLSWTLFFFVYCQESEVSFPAASDYFVPVHKDENPCCSPFRFVLENSS